MFHDVKAAPGSPAKGKAKEETHWHSGWWDFYPLVEHPQRPIEWSNSSVIFTPHPTQPLVLARHFSSSKQFTISSPPPILASPGSYEPPSIISVSPDDDWLFAYYPGRGCDGAGCLWKRGLEIDKWTIQEWWGFAPGAGVVTVAWLGTARERVTDSSGRIRRLPPCGPHALTSLARPTLALVTQNHQFTLCFLRLGQPLKMKMLTCPLAQPAVVGEDQPNHTPDVLTQISALKLCFKASICLGYNESSIIVATRSRFLPSFGSNISSSNSQFDLGQDNFSNSNSTMDEACDEDPAVDLCEIRFDSSKLNATTLSLSSNPLPPVRHPRTKLATLSFITKPPIPRPVLDSSHSPSQRKEKQTGCIYLSASFIDFGDFSSTPKSELVLYSLTRNTLPSTDKDKSSWICRQIATRSFSTEILTFVLPCKSRQGSHGVFIGLLEPSGTVYRRSSKVKEVPVGYIKALNLPDLADSDLYDSSLILSPTEKAGREATLSAVISPNDALICTISPSLWVTQTSIQSLPKLKAPQPRVDGKASGPPISSALTSAVLLRKSSSDLIHSLSLPSITTHDVTEALYHSMTLLEIQQSLLRGTTVWQALGLAMEIYKNRAAQLKPGPERDDLKERWQTAHDICSLAASNSAFDECREDTEAVWQLVGLSGWIMNLVENLMKECVLSNDFSASEGTDDNGDDLFGSLPSSPYDPPPLNSPVFLHLVHPYALKNFKTAIGNVHRFRNYLRSLTAGGENAQIARDVLLDLVDCCGVDLEALGSLLESVAEDVKSLPAEEARRSLVACQPSIAMQPHLKKFLKKLSDSPVIDKARLFIKPFELVDGIGRMSLDSPKKEKEKDVISKGTLVKHGASMTCLRCGGQTQITRLEVSGPGHASLWRSWEAKWRKRCICGGSWIELSESNSFGSGYI